MMIKQIITMEITLLLGILGMPLTNYLKEKLHFKDVYALLLSGFVATLLAFVQLFAQGYFTQTPILRENFPVIFLTIYTVANTFFRLFKYGTEKFI